MDQNRIARTALYDETLLRVTAEEETARETWWTAVQEMAARGGTPATQDEAHARRTALQSIAMGMEYAYAAYRGFHSIHDYAEGRASAAADRAYPIETPAWARGFLAGFERRVSP